MPIAGYGETLHPLAFTWDYALAGIMCDIKLDIHVTFHGNALRGNAITMQVSWKNLASFTCECHAVISNSAFDQHCAPKTFAKRVAFFDHPCIAFSKHAVFPGIRAVSVRKPHTFPGRRCCNYRVGNIPPSQ